MWETVKRLLRETRGNALWDLIKATLGVLAAILILRLIEHWRRVPSDLAIDIGVGIPIGILSALLIARKRSPATRPKLFRIVIGGFVVLELCLLAAWWIAGPPRVYTPFAATYELHGNQLLGKPQTEEKTDDIVYQGSYEHALVIFFHRRNAWFVLSKQDLTWKERGDSTMEDETKWKDRQWLSEQDWMGVHSRPPEGKSYPDGGIAKLWFAESDWWRKIGWEEWGCPYPPRSVYYQRFEHGYIMGAFRGKPDYAYAVILTLNDDGSWSADRDDSRTAPACCADAS